jgi:hypothetical protein
MSIPMPLYSGNFVSMFNRVGLTSPTGIKLTGQSAFAGPLRENYFQQYFLNEAKIQLKTMAAHHIIPISFAKGGLTSNTANENTVTNPVFKMMEKLTTTGYFSLVDGRANLMWLPMQPSETGLTGLALHTNQGALIDQFHSKYNDAVRAALLSIQEKVFGQAGLTGGSDDHAV